MSTVKAAPSHKHTLSRSEKIAIPIIIIIAIWVVYSISQPTAVPNAPTTSTQISGPPTAPDFSLPVVSGGGLTGQSVTLASFRGKVVLLEFMEPWCPHCQKMAPVLENLYNQYGKENVVFISVAGPWQGATADDTARFINDYGSTWSYAYDSSGSTLSAYGVNATPTFIIIGKDGSIVARYEGEQSYDTLAAGLTAAS
jgi:thiol-disulfide isomerase/thioredoxin